MDAGAVMELNQMQIFGRRMRGGEAEPISQRERSSIEMEPTMCTIS
jgi:hypothetical protein